MFEEPGADIALTAPTGLAAANIDGQTLHSLFSLSVEHGEKLPKYSALKQHNIFQTRAVMKDLGLLVIDEISMVSAEMLLTINLRLQEIFGADELFGGKCVVVFGDLLQLPPVHGKRPFEPLSGDNVHDVTGGLRIPSFLWENFKFLELAINQRQAGKDNEVWSSILGRIRIGRHTPEDVNLLRERLVHLRPCELPKEYLIQIVDAFLQLQQECPATVCLLPKRKMMEAFNAAVMEKIFPGAVEAVAIDEVDGRTKADKKRALDAVKKIDKLGDSRNTADLEKSLLLCEGVRIMLRKNLDTAKGLVNGAMGVVRQIIRSSDSVIQTLVVQFDGILEFTNISKDTRKIKLFDNSYLHRTQFPISIGYALTIHKAQGMSLSHVFCDLGNSVFSTGQTYVALSRCKTFEGLHLINLTESRITTDNLAIREYVRLKSQPITKAGFSHSGDLPKDDLKRKKRQQPSRSKDERIWYETSATKKAKAVFTETIRNITKKEKGPKEKEPKKKVPKKKDLPKKDNGDFGGQAPPLTPGNIDIYVNRIHELVPAMFIPTSDIIEGGRLVEVYRRVLVPAFRQQAQNIGIYGMARELNPDPFGTIPSNRLWLHGSTISKYLDTLKDDVAEMGGPSIYNLGPYTSSYTGHQGNIRDFVGMTFSEKPFTRLRLDTNSLHFC